MSIGREYNDAEGNYWIIETPYYIPPQDAIKHPEYVRVFISASDRAKMRKQHHTTNRQLIIGISAIVFELILIAIR